MNKVSEDTTAAVVDGLLRFVATGGFVTTALVTPNAVQIFDKPLAKILSRLDERSRERELRRVTHYMKQKGLITYSPKDYEHGIKITKEGKKRLERTTFTNIIIKKPHKWDNKWRLVFFDIPMEENKKRYLLTAKLKNLGFQQLQKSIWIHPFSCRFEIEVVAEEYGLRKFITYVEISHIDADEKLKARFKSILMN